MMQEKVDLRLSLSLHPSQNPFPLPSSTYSHSPFPLCQKPQWINNLLHSSVEEAQPMLKGIDVNRKPGAESVLEEEEGEEASSPGSTLSSVSGKRSERDPFSSGVVVHGLERTSSRGVSDEEDGEGSRKKLRLSKEQSAVLEECFKEHNTLSPKQKIALAKQLNLRPRQVEVWFQNRRARTKLKQNEVDCEYLKRWCERLTQENRRLQKEAAELRALKLLSPMQLPVNMMPPTTLTICPSCQRVISPSKSSNSSSTTATATSSSPPANRQHHRLFLAAPYSNPNPWALAPFGSAYLNRSS
ncbi:homeobox-leucine zipper protein HAT4-like [Phoenix dactylifera]|uniref:Homeobox-leucine zipper protein HAT4-like n=1 Tax=Phoenix dactylifera TaxID=42345 RepID=A0A8B7MVT3_PHODC|nr:homeobox-leucine zipper protein HAT4-like [Phoenix dactylifera]